MALSFGGQGVVHRVHLRPSVRHRANGHERHAQRQLVGGDVLLGLPGVGANVGERQYSHLALGSGALIVLLHQLIPSELVTALAVCAARGHLNSTAEPAA